MKRYLLSLSLAAAAGFAATPALALPCAGFTDVDSTSAFCPNVEWLKNRGVTTGCTSATLYCPTDPVSRLAMAAFMNRLGGALTPATLLAEGLGNTPATFNCQTADFTVTGFPRKATATALYSAQFAAATNYYLRIYFSTDAGANWTNLNGPVVHRTASGAGLWSHVTQHAELDLTVGQSYRFAAFYETFPTTGVAAIDTRCTVSVTIGNRNSLTSPLDERVIVAPTVDQ